MSDDDLDVKRFEHDARLAWFKAWSPLAMTAVTGVAAYLTVDLHNQRMDVRKLTLEQARFEHEAAMDARTFERDTNQKFIEQFLAQDDEVKRLALIDFIHQTAKDEGLRGWAQIQKRSVAAEVAELRKALAEAEQAKRQALQAQLERFQREQEAEAAAQQVEAELLAAKRADRGGRGEARRKVQAARAAAAAKKKAAADAAAAAEAALAAAEAASAEAETTEVRVRGADRAAAPAAKPSPPPLGAAGSLPRPPTFENYTCRCALKSVQIAAPDKAAADGLCAKVGRLCTVTRSRRLRRLRP